MGVLEEFGIDYNNRSIWHSGGTTGIYSSRNLYSNLMDTFDELGQMDDTVPMSAQTPTEFTLISSWFMHYDCFEYLSGGAIQTDGWDCTSVTKSGIRILDCASAGYTNFVDADTGDYITGTTTQHSGVLLAYDNTLRRLWVRIEDTGNTFNNASEVVGNDGMVGEGTLNQASRTGENLWPNIYTLGTITGGTNLYVIQNGEIINPWWSSGHIDILVYTKEAGTEIDAGILTIFDRKWGALYDHYEIDLTVGGRNAVPLATSNDVNNTGVEGTVSGFDDITFTFGPDAKDLSNGNGFRPYNVVIDLNAHSVYDYYEYTKFSTRSGSVKDLSGLSGDRYRSLEAGNFGESKQAAFGTFAGGKYFGTRGVWIENYDANDSQNFQLIDSSGVSQVPPNTVTVEVTSVVSGDSVTVFKLVAAGGAIWDSEYQAQTGNVSGTLAVYVKGDISGDTPGDGWVSISNDVYEYTAYQTGEFYVPLGIVSGYAENSEVYVPIIYTGAVGTSVQQTLIYGSTVPILIRVRKKGILPFEVESTITNAGRSVAAIRTTDSIA